MPDPTYEVITSLKGPKGDPGEQGARGEQGLPGPPGPEPSNTRLSELMAPGPPAVEVAVAPDTAALVAGVAELKAMVAALLGAKEDA